MKHQLQSHDLTKIHSEILQLCQQRFLLCTAAVALFGGITAKLIPESLESIKPPVIVKVCMGSLVLNIVLLVLFVQSHLLRKMLRTYSTYLLATEASKWELDWKKFRKTYQHLAQYDTMAHTYIFLGLCLLSGSFPLVLALMVGLGLSPLGWLATALGGGLINIGFILTMGSRAWHHSESTVEERWKSVLNDK